MSKVKASIIKALKAAPDSGLTDAEIATRTTFPVPSVRRARLQMENDGDIFALNGSEADRANPLRWKLYPE